MQPILTRYKTRRRRIDRIDWFDVVLVVLVGAGLGLIFWAQIL